MPASLILLPAFVIGVAAWLAAWWYTRKTRADQTRDEVDRLRNHAVWLEQRLDIARQERWDREMILTLSEQLGAACTELARARHGPTRSAQVVGPG